jgi:hypothetical protein
VEAWVWRRLVPGAAVAACLLVAACGGGGGIPTDASVKTFCSASDRFAKSTKFTDGLKAADRLRETGTPKGIPADARDGFELVVQLVTESKDQSGLEKRYKALSAKQKGSVQKLDAYIAKTC